MIDRIGKAAPQGTPRRAGVAGERGAFRVGGGGDGPDGAAGAVGDIHSVTLGGMLALQADACGAVEDREARRRGHDLLGALGDLQRDLLDGEVGGPRLRQLADLAKSVPRAADRGLRDVVAAIALRASIEIARRETAASTRQGVG